VLVLGSRIAEANNELHRVFLVPRSEPTASGLVTSPLPRSEPTASGEDHED
jgi:hypothetical protein